MERKRFYITLLKGNTPLFATKIKGSKISVIPFANGSEIHLSSQSFVGYILSDSNSQNFILRETLDGDDLFAMTIIISQKTQPRVIVLQNYAQIEGFPQKFNSRPPIHTLHGFTIDFSGRTGMKSIKNSIIVDENDIEYISSRKIQKNMIAIDASPLFPPNYVFLFGVGQVICKK